MNTPITDFDPTDFDPRAEAIALALYETTSVIGDGSDESHFMKCFEAVAATYVKGITAAEWKIAALAECKTV
jgi:hypothetical protein